MTSPRADFSMSSATPSHGLTTPGLKPDVVAPFTSPRHYESALVHPDEELVYQGVQSVYYSVSPRHGIPSVMTDKVAFCCLQWKQRARGSI